MLRKSKLTKEQIIELYNNGKTAKEIGLKAGVSDSAILGILRRSSIKRRLGRKLGYSSGINENVFTETITEKHAYYLGLIAADGSVHPSRNKRHCFSIELASKDIELLTGLADFIRLDRSNIKTYTRRSRNSTSKITIHSKLFTDTLLSLGISSGKSKRMNIVANSFRENFTAELMRYWYAGYFDGDGTASAKRLSLTAESSDFLEAVKSDLVKLLNLNPDALKIYKTGKNCFQLNFNRKLERIKVGRWLYRNNDLALSRKAHFYREVEVNIPELSWNPEMGIRTEDLDNLDQGQRIEGEKI